MSAAAEPIRVEAATAAAAMALVADLAPLGRPDLVRLDGERWEVRLHENAGTQLRDVLGVVEAWLTVWDTPCTSVSIDGRARVMSARARR